MGPLVHWTQLGKESVECKDKKEYERTTGQLQTYQIRVMGIAGGKGEKEEKDYLKQ